MTAEQLISIVDDDASMREALVELVRSLGYHVGQVVSVRRALGIWE